jgi:hypothetical protein
LTTTGIPSAAADRDLIECHVDRVIVRPQAVEVRLISAGSTELSGGEQLTPCELTTLTLPWAAPTFVAVKGIVHEPAAKPTINPETRDALLAAIAKARRWIEDLRLGRVATLAEIADREDLGERHVRLLVPLAFVSPAVVAAIRRGHRANRSHRHRARATTALLVGQPGATVQRYRDREFIISI